MDLIQKKLFECFSEDELNSPAGDIITSAEQTLKSGEIYFLGFNPGGEESPHSLLRHAIEQLYRGDNLYLIPYAPNKIKNKLTPLQRRYIALFQGLNLDPASVFSTNLIFRPSRNSTLVDYASEAKKCWKAHQIFLDMIKPHVILCNGNGAVSSFSYIQQFIQSAGDIIVEDSGHSKWKIRSVRGVIQGRQVLVIGIPHMSYYDPRKALDILKQRIFPAIGMTAWN